MAYSLKDAEFRAVAAGVLDSLPGEFRKHMENVVVVVEDYPSVYDAERAKVPRGRLLGLFHGITRPAQEWRGGRANHLPERIVLYKRNIEAVCSTKEELIEEIRLTVLHEIGHYFGMSEEDLEKYETDR